MYSPKIKEEYVRQLYQLKLVEHKAMTTLVNEAIQQYLITKQINRKETDYDGRTILHRRTAS